MTRDGGEAEQPTSYELQPPAPPTGARQDDSYASYGAYDQDGVDTPYDPDPDRRGAPPYGHRSGGTGLGAGRLIGGRYRLLSRLGIGGMGTVWRARDEVVDRDVAVKEPRVPDHVPEQQRQNTHQRMQREARAAARIDHPSVVTVHDVVVEDGSPWIVMELVRGRSLGDVLSEGTLDRREAARIGLAVLGALRAAHAAGVLHRDVKPDNVLLAPDGRVVLTDFGIAQIEGEQRLTESGAFVGSPEYIAPERLLGRRPGPESDLWSLGVVLYTAVEGVSPFRRSHAPGTFQAILTAEPQPPAHGTGPLGELVMRLLHKDPAARPAAEEIGEVLEAVARPVPQAPTQTQALAQAPTQALTTLSTVPPAGDGGSKWVPPVLQRSRKARWGLAGGLLVAAAAVGLVLADPFASRATMPEGWTVRDEREVVEASLAVPGDYQRTVEEDKGDVVFRDPSGVFTVYLGRASEQPRSETDKPPRIGSAKDEAKKLMARYTSGPDALAEAEPTLEDGAGPDVAEVTTVYRAPGSGEDDPKRCRRSHIIVDGDNDTKVAWRLEVWMPADGKARDDGERIFEDVIKHLQLQES
ncbi:serine/threonine-protein kinase [Streptomyces sp. UNOC14_S4]|uniref:serine/threonine-protein kinase n=1 Tax=Streptomyces sp. UNOC14_S4 TaxID=2872340 RepID=UPI001E31E3C4|nr:serine/threonine-protein kinase [Streptomyces sp. UNOC14_S4]MCC3770417.1 serine/threonine protein kinase [Streptomyces sp. UNOC14_S4]